MCIKKPKKTKKEKPEIEEKDEFQKTLENLLDEDADHSIVNVKSLSLNLRVIQNIFLDYLLLVLINTILIVACCGWFKTIIIVNNFYELFIFVGIFATLDYWLKALVFHFKPILIIKTFGLIFTIISSISIISTGVLMHYVFHATYGNAWALFGIFILFLIIRTIITTNLKKLFIK